MAAKTVVVAGGTGFIGGALAQNLAKHRYKVLSTTRAWEPHGPNQIPWHILERHGLPNDTHAVINVTGSSIASPFRRWDQEFMDRVRDSRINPTQQLVKMIQAASPKPKVWISTSGVSYYGPDKGQQFAEESAPGDQKDFFVKLAVDWEKAAQLPKDAGVRQAVLRLGACVGRTGGLVKYSFWPTYLGVGGALGSGSHYMPWIHLDDATDLFIHVLQNDKCEGVFNGVAPDSIQQRDFVRAFARGFYPSRPSFCSIPEKMVRFIFGEERSDMLLMSQKVTPKRTVESGFQFEYKTIKSACDEVARLCLHDDELIRNKSVVGKFGVVWSKDHVDTGAPA